MRIPNSNRRRLKSFRKTAILLLLAYFAMGSGLVESSVLCLGEDGHLAMESAVSCALCSSRILLPVPTETLIPEGSPAPGCGPCQDFSINPAREPTGITALPPPGSFGSDVALPPMEPSEGSRATIASASAVSGPSGMPDPMAPRPRTVVLLI